MPLLVLVILSLHILAATFWAGTSFTLARTGGAAGEILFRPQMGAALIAVLAGGYLWHELHAGGFGTDEQVLGLGALCALVAAGVQGMVSGRAVSALRRDERGRGAFTHRDRPAHRRRPARSRSDLHGGGALCLKRQLNRLKRHPNSPGRWPW